MAGFFIEGFYRCRISQEGNHLIPVFSHRLLCDDHLVVVEDPSLHHTVSFYPQHKYLFIGKQLRRDGDIILNILLCQDRHSCGNGPDQRYVDHFPAGQRKIIIQDLDGPGFCGIPSYVSIPLQCLQVGVDRRGGFQMDGFADLAHSRRISFA